ncbi:MAG: MFS transporter [Rhodospirillales bacterium]
MGMDKDNAADETASGEENSHSKKTLAAGMVGNVIEWYDFTLYGYLAVVISQLFFPHENPTVSLLATYGVFAAGFLMRPLGAALFGYLGDTLGRKPVLMLSVMMMVVPTLLLGILPTYADWGIWASICLVLIRLIQGISVGGEFSGSVTYLVETAPTAKRGFAGSWANMGSVTGMLLGAGTPALVIWVLGQPETNEWGWRLPFLFGGVIGLLALFLRHDLPEPAPTEKEIEGREGMHPIRRLLKEEPGVFIRMALFSISYGAVFYLPLVYLPTWLSLYTPIKLHEALFIVTLGMVVQLALIPSLAILSDRAIRRTHLLALVFLVIAVAAVPLFSWASDGLVWEAVVVFLVFSALIATPLAVAPTTYAEAFDRSHRLTGYSVSFNVGFAVGGGTAPLVATWLIAQSGDKFTPAIYLAALALLGVIVMIMTKDRSREPLR